MDFQINKQDEWARKHLKDIKWNQVKEPKRFTLDLFFGQNSYCQKSEDFDYKLCKVRKLTIIGD